MIMKNSSRINYCLVFFLSICLLFIYRINGQISTPCTASMITSFTPCLNFITGSTANGQSSPTQDCCDSVKSMVADSVDCGCLILTGNVPLSLPFNRTLAISLPQICNGGVPLRCKSSGVPLPAPGPALFQPPPPPTSHPPFATHAPAYPPRISPRASKASSSTTLAPTPVDETTPASPPKTSHTLAPGAHPGIKPIFNPAAGGSSSASALTYHFSPLFLMFVAIAVLLATK
ncbi:hypothetical protein M9H77_01470 [Catharanthus roseus]|uniref:Uncharacterized protein n=1 Tax=Catharanthus roseus TaxID=4058 RepID=A0ACC0C5K7_CATRO|nr:hypothetical protein M9H77_01470 [Catharanthus roseus]